MVQVRTQRAPKLVLLFLPCMYMHMYNIECFGHAMSCLITEVILIVGNASIKKYYNARVFKFVYCEHVDVH